MQTHKTPRRVWLSMRPYAGWTAIAAAVATLAACSGGKRAHLCRHHPHYLLRRAPCGG